MNNVLDVEVLSSNSLDIETQNKITSIIEKNFIEKKVFVNFIQDRSITNGIIFKIGDQIRRSIVFPGILIIYDCPELLLTTAAFKTDDLFILMIVVFGIGVN